MDFLEGTKMFLGTSGMKTANDPEHLKKTKHEIGVLSKIKHLALV